MAWLKRLMLRRTNEQVRPSTDGTKKAGTTFVAQVKKPGILLPPILHIREINFAHKMESKIYNIYHKKAVEEFQSYEDSISDVQQTKNLQHPSLFYSTQMF